MIAPKSPRLAARACVHASAASYRCRPPWACGSTVMGPDLHVGETRADRVVMADQRVDAHQVYVVCDADQAPSGALLAQTAHCARQKQRLAADQLHRIHRRRSAVWGEPRHSCRPPRGCQLTEAVASVPPPRTLTLTLCVEWSHLLHVVCCTLNVANADAPRAMPYAARCRLHVVFCTARASVRPRAARYMNARTPIRMHASANGKQRRRPKTVLQENAQLASLWGCLRSSELVLAGPRRSHLHHPGRSRRTPRVRKARDDAPFNFPIQSIPAAVWPQTSACPLPHGVTAGY